MKGYRFYLEHESKSAKRKGEHSGNVTALCIDEDPFVSNGVAVQGAITGIFASPNSPVMYSPVGLNYLWDYCKRIPETEARKIHPELFKRLDEKE